MNKLFNFFRRLCTAFLIVLIVTVIYGEQININRVEQMPNLPQPYLMRDWRQVTLDYDSLVFDLERSGQYLPLIWINTNTINYPNHNSFGLHTVVGTPYPSNAEAINVLPAVISASLIGIDKSDQDGHNWVLGCEEWFNRRPEENVYLNGPTAQSGDDWWYAMMPNVFFYQLYDLYPGTGHFNYQLTSVADQWLKAVETMGGSATPWKKASMNYRGWYLSTMTPYTSGVREPESAGSIAWILYNAFIETADQRYRIGAEWALEFLSAFPDNAAYELQLPYGVYTAARMNAELGTNYNVDKMLNWCFDPEGNAREWGVTLGNWGGYDCDGLVGEALNDGYAFVMNGFEMASALVPMVRYDDRYARAIGKWVLNLANASRLFYSNYLPADRQDGEAWSYEYDPDACIAHESMREFAIGSGVSPFATGDAMGGDWGETNFALYGASHVGILGGIIDTTDIQGILRLDLCKTDFFQDNSYPSYLYYNPHSENKTITIDVGNQTVDLYDAVSNDYLIQTISGQTSITIPADGVVLLVQVPSGGTINYQDDKILANGIVIDYNSGQTVSNYQPRIKAIAADSTTVLFNQSINIYCTADDRDADDLTYTWSVGSEMLDIDSTVLNWTAPDADTILTIYCSV
ncbi:MAG: laminin G, partial [Candidatus Marinimicrobia bacterium]|nr:laminin G [Candidatus Neomarinimicrobiota bacterium]